MFCVVVVVVVVVLFRVVCMMEWSSCWFVTCVGFGSLYVCLSVFPCVLCCCCFVSCCLHDGVELVLVCHVCWFWQSVCLSTTVTAITTTYETVANALTEKKQVYMVLRDVAKAFDKVWHNGLKCKILRLILPEILKKILCNFLEHRTAKINIGNKFSKEINLSSGVPQGSVYTYFVIVTLYLVFRLPLDLRALF